MNNIINIEKRRELLSNLESKVAKTKALNYCVNSPQEFVEQILTINDEPIILTLEQKNILKALHNNSFVVNDSHKRRMGITTMIAAYMLWHALYNPNTTSVVMQPTYNDIIHFRTIFMSFYDSLPDSLKLKLVIDNKFTLQFENNSYIRMVNPHVTNLRGFGFSFIACDDYIRYTHRDRDECMTVIPTCMHYENSKPKYLSRIL